MAKKGKAKKQKPKTKVKGLTGLAFSLGMAWLFTSGWKVFSAPLLHIPVGTAAAVVIALDAWVSAYAILSVFHIGVRFYKSVK